MGEERSLAKVASRCGKHPSLIERWSVRYQWQERLITWQHEDAQRQIEAKEKAALEVARQIEKRRQQVHDRAWDMAQQLYAKAKEMLDWPLKQEVTHTESKNADGDTTLITNITNPANWNFGTAAKLVETSDALARLALGLPQEMHALTDKDGGSSLPTPAAPPLQLVVNVTREENDPINDIINHVTTIPPTGNGNGERRW
jgi:hypothetical protein